MGPHLKAILRKGLLWLSICSNMAKQCTGCGAEIHSNNKCYTCGYSYCSNCVKETKKATSRSGQAGQGAVKSTARYLGNLSHVRGLTQANNKKRLNAVQEEWCGLLKFWTRNDITLSLIHI